jgi:hypothetical protein
VSPARSLEEQLLARPRSCLAEVVGDEGDTQALRLEILEACAARTGGFSLQDYRGLFGGAEQLTTAEALIGADAVLPALERLPIPPPLALAALSKPFATVQQTRSAGQYYTDWRLAQHLAKGVYYRHRPGQKVVDPASGTGILLAAIAWSIDSEDERARFIGSSAAAADLSVEALRGVRLALASMTSDLKVMERLEERLRPGDSLLGGASLWADVAPDGFDAVIGNPPWEKLKVTRHEHLLGNGFERKYGSGYENSDLSKIGADRARLLDYVRQISARYELHGGGELDLYKAFLALATELAAPGGRLAMLVPAGLIRSEGTHTLRRHLFGRTDDLRFEVSDNRARYFAIDSRFKFLVLRAKMTERDQQGPSLSIAHLDEEDDMVVSSDPVRVQKAVLAQLRPDLTVPEVRSSSEWDLLEAMYQAQDSASLGAEVSKLRIVRELDMTRDRSLFHDDPSPAALPLVEGRMVHQFRHATKSFVSGSGRSAVWRPNDFGSSECTPQFWVDGDDLSASLSARADLDRVGFCDITGQTNERSMLAARIPAGVICNNKVPTITFGTEGRLSDRGWIWLAIANSFAFDWLLRRVVTTTVNYFILRSVPMPTITDRRLRVRIVELAQKIEDAYQGECEADLIRIGSWRAELDALAFQAYGVSPEGARLIFEDFPLIDRGQPVLEGSTGSTVTRDLVLAALSELTGQNGRQWRQRADQALMAGAHAYVPAQLAKSRPITSDAVT